MLNFSVPIRTEKSSKAATARLEIAEAVTGLLQVHSCIWAYKGGKADGMRLPARKPRANPARGLGASTVFARGLGGGSSHCLFWSKLSLALPFWSVDEQSRASGGCK